MNAKLKLNLEDLAVDSFDTTRPERPGGTVFGEQCTCYTNCTCPGCPTCDASCNGTCDASCDGTGGGTWCDYMSCGGTCYDQSCGCGGSVDFCTTHIHTYCRDYLCN